MDWIAAALSLTGTLLAGWKHWSAWAVAFVASCLSVDVDRDSKSALRHGGGQRDSRLHVCRERLALVEERKMKVRDRLQSITVPCGGDVNDLEINVVIGKGAEATLHPILPNGRGVFRDDAPFCNLNCVFIVPDLDTQIKRPPLFGQSSLSSWRLVR